MNLLAEKVKEYLGCVQGQLQDPSTRKEALERLQHRAILLRQAVRTHPVLGTLDETQGDLFPLPSHVGPASER